MANGNTDFLRFSAYSMKELITRKLAEDSRFTDQVYEGSNLAILIDIVSYIYQCLSYQLNSAAAESMFADTQLYDNMIRLVQFIGYNPRGCIPTSFVGIVKAHGPEDTIRQMALPRFTYFATQKTGKDGGRVCFSTKKSYPMESDSVNDGIEVEFFNGKWRAYSTVYTSSGLENEVFTLDGLKADSANGKYVPSEYIQVFIATKYSVDGNPVEEYRLDEDWYNDSDGIFLRSSKELDELEGNDSKCANLYNPRSRIYTVQLNENRTYEIRFGNGVTGRKLMRGDRVYVFYLDSDGPMGEIDLTDVDFSTVKLQHDWLLFKSVLPADLVEGIFGEDDVLEKTFETAFFDGKPLNQLIDVQAKSSVTTSFKQEEDVQDIRDNAPGWFKTGNRLITATDTEYYIKTHGDKLDIRGVVDVKCMNNLQYVATFYKWLYENGIKSKDEPARAAERSQGVDPGKYYLDNVTFDRTNFKYVDPADANNTYLWIKTESDTQDIQVVNSQNIINDKLYYLKTITTEYQIVKPVTVHFAICANPDLDDIKARYFDGSSTYFDEKCESLVEVTLDDNIIYVSSNIQKLVYDEIVKAFDVNTLQLGCSVKFQDIVNNIYAINGVQRVRTVFVKDGGYRHVYDGLSFASWSDESVLHFHEDLQVGNVMRHVEDFQFPKLREDQLLNRIKIITKALHQVHAIKF